MATLDLIDAGASDDDPTADTAREGALKINANLTAINTEVGGLFTQELETISTDTDWDLAALNEFNNKVVYLNDDTATGVIDITFTESVGMGVSAPLTAFVVNDRTNDAFYQFGTDLNPSEAVVIGDTLLAPGETALLLLHARDDAADEYRLAKVGKNVAVGDEGNQLTAGVESFNFVGSGVTATNSGENVTVSIPGPSAATFREVTTNSDAVTQSDDGNEILITTIAETVDIAIPDMATLDDQFVTTISTRFAQVELNPDSGDSINAVGSGTPFRIREFTTAKIYKIDDDTINVIEASENFPEYEPIEFPNASTGITSFDSFKRFGGRNAFFTSTSAKTFALNFSHLPTKSWYMLLTNAATSGDLTVTSGLIGGVTGDTVLGVGERALVVLNQGANGYEVIRLRNRRNFVTANSNRSISGSNDGWVFRKSDTSTPTYTIDDALPVGHSFIVQNTGSSGNVTVDTAGSETIEGAASMGVLPGFSALFIKGGDWFVIPLENVTHESRIQALEATATQPLVQDVRFQDLPIRFASYPSGDQDFYLHFHAVWDGSLDVEVLVGAIPTPAGSVTGVTGGDALGEEPVIVEITVPNANWSTLAAADATGFDVRIEVDGNVEYTTRVQVGDQ